LAGAPERARALGVAAGAEDRRRTFHQHVIAAEDDLRRELGDATMDRTMLEARRNLGLVDGVDYLAISRRIFVVARRRSVTSGDLV
jgi:hypothetical protein